MEANPATIEWLLSLAKAGPAATAEPELSPRRTLWPFGRTSDREVTVRALLSAGIPAHPNWPVSFPARTKPDQVERRLVAVDGDAASPDPLPSDRAEPFAPAASEAVPTEPVPTEPVPIKLLAVESPPQETPPLVDALSAPPGAGPESSEALLERAGGEVVPAVLEPVASQAVEAEVVAFTAGEATCSSLLARVRAYATLGSESPELPELSELPEPSELPEQTPPGPG